ncbi:MAG: hypothetical protein WD871_00200 [Xanthobacteraceae bacterium]
MTKFNVIQGGGGHRQPPSPDAEWASEQLNRLIVEIFRAVVRGDDYGDRVSREFSALFDHVAKTKLQLQPVIHRAVSNANRDLTESGERSDHADEMTKVVLAAMCVAAESFDKDEYAKGRRFQRLGDLRSAIEQHIISTETRSGEHGWSYLEHLTKDLGSKRPHRRKPRGSTDRD